MGVFYGSPLSDHVLKAWNEILEMSFKVFHGPELFLRGRELFCPASLTFFVIL